MPPRTRSFPSPPSGGQGPADATGDSAELFTSVARQCLHELDASAVTVYVRMPDEPVLAAAVVVLSPFGVGSPAERVPLDDPVYAAARAYQTGQIWTTQSHEVQRRHPDLGVFVPYPYTVTAAAFAISGDLCGSLAIFWPGVLHDPSESQKDYLRRAVTQLSSDLARTHRNPDSIAPPRVPLVVSSAPEAASKDSTKSPQEELEELTPWTAPLIFHLQKLAINLTLAMNTRDAVEIAVERLISGFRAHAVVICLTEADRLHVVGSLGCSEEYLRSLNGMPLSATSPETGAIAGRHQVIYEPRAEGDSLAYARNRGDSRDEYVWVILPLIAGARTLGVCSIGFDPEQQLIVTEQSPLSALSGLLGQTFGRTQLHDAQQALAQKLQQALLPRVLPQFAGVASTSRYEPPDSTMELGGDWYDLIKLPAGGVAAVIGDVQGHNTSATVTMGQLRSAVRGYALEGHGPSAVLHRTNRLLIDLDTDLFATCCCVWLDPDTGAATVVSAGHPRPLIRNPDGTYLSVDAETGPPLGVNPNPSYQASVLTVEPAALLVLYTDGLSGRDGELARASVESAIEGSNDELETIGDRLIGRVGTRTARQDDAALLLLRYEGPSSVAKEYVRRLTVHRHDLQGVARARRFLDHCLDEWDLGPLSDSAELLASEVVTNALIHGDSDVDVCLRRYPDRFRMEVRDSDSHPAMLVTLDRAADQAEGGRGMVIVSALASSWGNSPSGRGKTVWFEMNTDELTV
jgi:anti-sigma regulatory factor (Ser/Thr protein kinase)